MTHTPEEIAVAAKRLLSDAAVTEAIRQMQELWFKEWAGSLSTAESREHIYQQKIGLDVLLKRLRILAEQAP